ncbi:MAG: hypothetical protein KJ714_04170 [Euryarchaeota archaeon]|nr:hypothetical protein [Euryarchaeota archaeon]
MTCQNALRRSTAKANVRLPARIALRDVFTRATCWICLDCAAPGTPPGGCGTSPHPPASGRRPYCGSLGDNPALQWVLEQSRLT